MAALTPIHPPEDALRAFALGKLDDGAAAVLLSHLDGCPTCCKRVAAVSGDDFLDRLRQAHGRSFTPAPAQALAASLGDPQPPSASSQTPVPNLPPELAANPQYEIVRELGRGGMGVVYLAKNKLMDRLEVLKVVNQALLDRPGAIERFLREIRSAAKLSHPNIVAAHSAVQQGELLAFAMEYIDGQDLASVVKAQGPLPVLHACYYVQQAALGLQHAHEQKMVHRDIKPQNLILTRKGKKHVVKVLDFGLAKATREKHDDLSLTGEGKMLGTPDYIAPEQSLDAASADIRADIYSLGCTLYYLLSGRVPFSGSSLGAVLLAHQMQEAKPLNLVRPEVPEELAAVVQKMMAKFPDKRYQTPLEVVQALAPFVKPGASSKSSLALSAGPMDAKLAALKVKQAAPPPPIAEVVKNPPEPAAVWESLTEDSIVSVTPRHSGTVRKPRAATGRERSSRNKWLIRGGIGAGVLLLALVGMWASGVFKVKVKTADGILSIEVNEPDPDVFVDGDKVTVSWQNGGKKAEIRVPPGTHKVEIKKDGFSVKGKDLTFKEGGKEIFRAELLPEKREVKAEPPPPRNVPPKAEAAKPGVPEPQAAKADAPARESASPKPQTPKAEDAKPPPAKDLLHKDSFWRGEGEYTVRGLPGQPAGKFRCTLRVTQRTGDKFKGVYEYGDGSECVSIFEGAVGDSVGGTGKRKIQWKHVEDIKGTANQRYPLEVEGTMEGAVLDLGFAHRDRNTGRVVGSGVVTFRIVEKDRLTEAELGKLESKEAPHHIFEAGTVWKGTARQSWVGDPKPLVYSVVLKVLERDGSSFRARLEIDNQRLIRECRGTIEKSVLKWHGKDEILIKGGPVGMEYTGRVARRSLTIRFAGFDEAIKKQSEGVAVLQLEQSPSKPAAKAAPPSVIGTWHGTFPDGKSADFPFRADHTVTGTNGFQGVWVQKGHKVTVMQSTPSRAPKWEGEIDPSGKTMRLRNDLVGEASYERR